MRRGAVHAAGLHGALSCVISIQHAWERLGSPGNAWLTKDLF
ncbi:MAG TPA: hypothetical protein VJN18_10435 [Polyangiaceae bacterium]|nr:hypothetical protein [Polyangiaceae bacterium]